MLTYERFGLAGPWGSVVTAVWLFGACTSAVDTQDTSNGELGDVVVASVGVSRVAPIEGPSVGGTIIAIHGSGFTPQAQVRVGVRSSPTVVFQSDVLLVALVPPGDGAGPADVTVVAGTTEDTLAGGFTYWENAPGTAPSLLEVRPDSGPTIGGTVVLLKGENFQSGASVFVGFRPASKVVIANATTATFIAPPSSVAGWATLAFVNGDGQVAKLDEGFQYYTLSSDSADPPLIGAVTPNQALQLSAAQLQVTGTGFAPDCFAIVGGLEAAVNYISPIELQVTTQPLPQGFADLYITNGDGQSAILTDAVEMVTLAPGECATKPQLCPPGTYCDATSCVPVKNDDEPCVADLQCASGVCDGGRCAFTCQDQDPICAGDDYCQGTACVPKKSDTESCSQAFECTSGACTAGFCGTGCAAAPDGCGESTYCDGTDCQPLKEDGQPCSDSGECLAGVCTGDLCGQGCQSNPQSCGTTAYCQGTECVPKKAGGEPCDSGSECLSSACDTGVDPAVCGGCAVDADCDDGNPCTDDVCGADAACEASPNTSACDDGNPCTYDDACMAGGCVGQTISCTDDAGVCGANRSCNGTSTCTTNFPGGGIGCNDNQACTHSDKCNGAGACAGTAITCSNDAGTCGANRSCNGTASCTVSFPGGGTSCSDGNACTISDTCNGAGSCVGGAAAPDGTECGNPAFRCCGGACADMTTNPNHCGGCNLACAAGQQCQNINTTTQCNSAPSATSGRCTCAGATSQCPNNTNQVGSQGQVCRAGQPLYNNICSPVGNAGCAPGQTDIDLTQCPDYCVY